MLALFFSAFSLSIFANSSASEFINVKGVHQNKQWKNLLHAQGSSLNISDPNFILSKEHFSFERELNATLTLIKNSPFSAMCRFPARYLFLNQFYSFKYSSKEITTHCPELKKFTNYVPFEELSLIYASEELASATSMMGHIFLRASGVNLNKNKVEHSIAFFTEINSFNPASLIYQGTVSGMDGLLLVKPFATDSTRYSDVEGRNLWIYDLKISNQNKKLLQYHLWELKQVEISYLFQSYNCATLTLELLSLNTPEVLNSKRLFVSPIDVVKAAKKHKLVSNESVLLAQKWKLSMLEQQISPALIDDIESFVLHNKPLKLAANSKVTNTLVTEYVDLLIKQPHIKHEMTSVHEGTINRWANKNKKENLLIDLSRYKNPTATKQDSHLGLKINRSANDVHSIELNFVPASHQLYGDNSQYFSESSLKIGEVTLVSSPKNTLKLEKLSLYDVQAFTPSTLGLPVLSGSFYIGYHHVETSKGRDGTFELSGGIGKTKKWTKDMSVYALVEAGTGLTQEKGYVFFHPKVGAIIQLISDNKLLVEHSFSYNRIHKDELIGTTNITWSWNGHKNKTFYFSFESNKFEQERKNKLSLGIDFHF